MTIFKFFQNDARDDDSPIRQVNLPKFTAVDFNVNAFSIILQTGANYQMTITDRYKDSVTVKVEEQALIIKEIKHPLKIHSFTYSPRITITIPATDKLTRVTGTDSAGSVKIIDLDLQDLVLDMDAGSTKLDNTNIQGATKLTINAGSLKISGGTMNLTAEMDAGSVKLDHCKLVGNNYITLTSGSFIMKQMDDVTCDLSALIGSINYRGHRTGHQFNNGAITGPKLTVHTEVGSIKII